MENFDYTFNKIYVLKSLGEADTCADDLYSKRIEPTCYRFGGMCGSKVILVRLYRAITVWGTIGSFLFSRLDTIKTC